MSQAKRKRTRSHSPRNRQSLSPVTATTPRAAGAPAYAVSEEIWRQISELELSILDLRACAEAQHQLMHHLDNDGQTPIPYAVADVMAAHLADCVTYLECAYDELRTAARPLA